MAAAGLGLRKSGKSRAKLSTQGWSPNSGQAAEDESGSFVDVLVSEQGQQSSSSGLTLPQQQNQQAGTQTLCPTSHEVQICVAASPTCHSSSHRSKQPLLIGVRVSLESAGAQQLAPLWDDLQSMRLRATVHTFWMRRLELFWAEDWSTLWAMVRAECDIAPVQNARHAEQPRSRSSNVFAKSLR